MVAMLPVSATPGAPWVPDWMTTGLTAEAYDELPEDVCRSIEVVGGAVTVSAAPTRRHQNIARRMANALEAACGMDLAVTTDVDLRLADAPLLNRRPDVVVYSAEVPDDEVLRPADALLVIEITSPNSVTMDTVDKPAEYAASGIRNYWRIAPEEAIVYTYALNSGANAYELTGEHKGRLSVSEPVELEIELADLLGS